MSQDSNRWASHQQIEWFRCQFAQHAGLPFAQVLPAQSVVEAPHSLGMHFYNSLYDPLTVLWLFLSRTRHANPTLAVAVESFLAWRLGRGLAPCSTDTGAHAKARIRLPEALPALLTRQTGAQAERAALNEWRWLGRAVKVFDGSSVSMPDTAANQRAFPRSRGRKRGVGFPLARIGVLFSLSTGTVLDPSIRRFAGKFQSELAMLREMFPVFETGDVLLSDRSPCSDMEVALLMRRGVDFVGRMHAHRHVDFRRGQRLGRDDHVVEWTKPGRPEWMSPEQYAELPDTLRIREFRYRIVREGYRPRVIVVATTLLDAESRARAEIATLYRPRWDAEINPRSLKTRMRMDVDVLRRRTPEMVRKEIRAHLPACNLIRTVIMQAALEHGRHPRQISFMRAPRTLEAFRPVPARTPPDHLVELYGHLPTAIASDEIANRPARPARLEPRQRKRRPKPYKLMTQPRPQARSLEAKIH